MPISPGPKLTTAELLAETVPSARAREREAFSVLIAETSGRLVLFGAGTLGRKVCAVLRCHGIEPLAFADNAAELNGCVVEGVPVMEPRAAAARYGDRALFVVAVFRGTGDGGMESRLDQLAALGCRYRTTFLPLAWKWPDELLPHFGATLPSDLLSHANELRAADAAWGDAGSRETFRSQLAWRLRGDFSMLSQPEPDQYYPRDLFELSAEERFVDGGAFDGDTLRVLGPNFSRAWAVEPDPKNAARLAAGTDSRVTVIQCAIGARRGKMRFADSGTVASAASANGGTTVAVETLDSLLSNEAPTFIKLDIEGSELDALIGAQAVVVRTAPLMAVCVYHMPEHFWAIPLWMSATLPTHTLALRAHQNDGFELVAYAVPPERRFRS